MSDGVFEFMLVKTRLGVGLVALVVVWKFFLLKIKMITAEEFRVLGEKFIRIAIFIDFTDTLGLGVLFHIIPTLHVT